MGERGGRRGQRGFEGAEARGAEEARGRRARAPPAPSHEAQRLTGLPAGVADLLLLLLAARAGHLEPVCRVVGRAFEREGRGALVTGESESEAGFAEGGSDPRETRTQTTGIRARTPRARGSGARAPAPGAAPRGARPSAAPWSSAWVFGAPGEGSIGGRGRERGRFLGRVGGSATRFVEMGWRRLCGGGRLCRRRLVVCVCVGRSICRRESEQDATLLSLSLSQEQPPSPTTEPHQTNAPQHQSPNARSPRTPCVAGPPSPSQPSHLTSLSPNDARARNHVSVADDFFFQNTRAPLDRRDALFLSVCRARGL